MLDNPAEVTTGLYGMLLLHCVSKRQSIPGEFTTSFPLRQHSPRIQAETLAGQHSNTPI